MPCYAFRLAYLYCTTISRFMESSGLFKAIAKKGKIRYNLAWEAISNSVEKYTHD